MYSGHMMSFFFLFKKKKKKKIGRKSAMSVSVFSVSMFLYKQRQDDFVDIFIGFVYLQLSRPTKN